MTKVRALARVNVAAIERNARRLARDLAPGAQLCAVVKADGYGHGAVPTARAALQGGATWLAVATADEAAHLRAAGITSRMLVMGALSHAELDTALEADADIVAWSGRWLRNALRGRAARVHVKLDTGMGRLGTRSVEQANRTAEAIDADPATELAGLMTHCATADELGDEFFGTQLERFRSWATPWKQRRPQLVLHAANSAATLRDREAHFDMVRCGIALYGLDPFQHDAAARELEAALELRSYVATVKRAEPGDSAGYGRRFVAEQPTRLATVPVGYGDGVRRALTNNAEVVIRGRRFPLVGTVSMDNVTIDVGADSDVAPGDDVLLLGGGVTAEEWAQRLQTINYEITCALSPRIPRVHHRDGEAIA